ncbi:MAG: transcription antitermination factor NusB [Candidatus Omnitrophica bacterium]|nr:transcription antitermination factor NusB [Candidatus Omnitrophota bacterium]
MRKRSLSREFALQVLYQLDITRDKEDAALAGFWQELSQEDAEQSVKDFTAELVKAVAQNLAVIDAKIAQFATNWQLKRMAVVDRNILRLGCCELMFRDDIPAKVSINEAVELAKRYSGREAGKFVNAILDKIKQEMKK